MNITGHERSKSVYEIYPFQNGGHSDIRTVNDEK
jgi:hypothetical protein